MGRITLVVALVVLALAIVFAWQIGSCQLNNIRLRENLRDVAAQNGTRIGLLAPKSDDDIREEAIRAAAELGIQLRPEQVTVQRSGKPENPHFDITADYSARVSLLIYSFNIHFIQSSAK